MILKSGMNLKILRASSKVGEVLEGQIVKTASNIEDSGDFIWFVTRAMTADEPNANGDLFPAEELKKSYGTFVGKGLFLNHDADDVKKSVGKVVDAWFVEAEGDNHIVCLCKIDRKAEPIIARKVESGIIDSVSMGCSVSRAECGICGKQMSNPDDFCEHMEFLGREITTDKGEKKTVTSINRGISFNELSLVSNPADEKAKLMSIFANKREEMVKVASELNIDINDKKEEVNMVDKQASEYTDFISNYMKEHEGASMGDAAKAWKEQKGEGDGKDADDSGADVDGTPAGDAKVEDKKDDEKAETPAEKIEEVKEEVKEIKEEVKEVSKDIKEIEKEIKPEDKKEDKKEEEKIASAYIDELKILYLKGAEDLEYKELAKKFNKTIDQVKKDYEILDKGEKVQENKEAKKKKASNSKKAQVEKKADEEPKVEEIVADSMVNIKDVKGTFKVNSIEELDDKKLAMIMYEGKERAFDVAKLSLVKKESSDNLIDQWDIIKEDTFEAVYEDKSKNQEFMDDNFIHIVRDGLRFVFYNGQDGDDAYTKKDIPRFKKVVEKAIKEKEGKKEAFVEKVALQVGDEFVLTDEQGGNPRPLKIENIYLNEETNDTFIKSTVEGAEMIFSMSKFIGLMDEKQIFKADAKPVVEDAIKDPVKEKVEEEIKEEVVAEKKEAADPIPPKPDDASLGANMKWVYNRDTKTWEQKPKNTPDVNVSAERKPKYIASMVTKTANPRWLVIDSTDKKVVAKYYIKDLPKESQNESYASEILAKFALKEAQSGLYKVVIAWDDAKKAQIEEVEKALKDYGFFISVNGDGKEFNIECGNDEQVRFVEEKLKAAGLAYSVFDSVTNEKLANKVEEKKAEVEKKAMGTPLYLRDLNDSFKAEYVEDLKGPLMEANEAGEDIEIGEIWSEEKFKIVAVNKEKAIKREASINVKAQVEKLSADLEASKVEMQKLAMSLEESNKKVAEYEVQIALDKKTAYCRSVAEFAFNKGLIELDQKYIQSEVAKNRNPIEVKEEAIIKAVDAQIASLLSMSDNQIKSYKESVERFRNTNHVAGKLVLNRPFIASADLGNDDESSLSNSLRGRWSRYR